jgi:hypothetical protein|tara:strand:- start:85 stop:447 length:363 start_codon:yes stop_codon:yes gene_type:complete
MENEQKRTTESKKRILKALEGSLGIVSKACEESEISRTQFYKWCKDDKDFATTVDELQNVVLDFAESTLHKLIADGNTAATIFFLKTKGKKRGFIEKQELDLTSGDEPIKININIKGVEY